MNKEFLAVFQLSKMIVFEVNYYTLSTNRTPHFATSAAQFVRNKRDYNQCGQAQNDLLPRGSAARSFYLKWDAKHLHDLTESEYTEMMQDLEALKEKYNHILRVLDESKKPYSPRISFYDTVELSKQTPKSA